MVETTRNYGQSAKAKVNELLFKLGEATLMVTVLIQLTDKGERDRTSHQIADEARKIAETRRQVAKDLTKIFEKAENLADVDNFLEEPHDVLRFKVDAAKAQRNGISVEDINSTLEMAMGGFIIGDIKKNALIDPTPIVMQVPLSARSQINRLIQLPVTNRMGKTLPLAELGSFKTETADQPIFHKDLRSVEFVTAETVGDLAAPVYGMMQVQDLLQKENDGKGYIAPDGTVVSGGGWLGREDSDVKTSFEWGGEWTVTYETFRDMGIAFMAALVLIYMLIVGLFGNFILPAIVIAPIPLTLIGIIPGHWIWDSMPWTGGAEFTATSMIGFIALAGIVVRNSILLVDFSKNAVINEGMSVVDAVIHSCEARTRPIAITAFALIGGSLVIITDPIFKGMAISLVFGGLVSTLLTLLVIPLGCISAGKALCVNADGETITPPEFDPDARRVSSHNTSAEKTSAYEESFFDKVKDVFSTVFGIIVTVSGLVFSALGGLVKLVFGRKEEDDIPKPPRRTQSEKSVVSKAESTNTAAKNTVQKTPIKGSMTVVVSTVIASAAILMTGNSVADGNKIQKEGVEAPAKNNVSLDASSVKESSVSLSTTTPPPPSGPFLGDGSQLVGEKKEISASNAQISPKLSPSIKPPVSQSITEEPKAPKEPSAPSMPVAASSAKAPQGVSSPKAAVVSEKSEIKVTQPVNDVAPIAPKTPNSPVVKKLEKPQKVAKEMIEPSSPEKTIDSFKPTAPEMEMTDKQAAKQLDAPKLDKAISAPDISSQVPKLQDPVVSKPQSQTKKPLAPVEAQVKKAPVMPEPAINKQRPVQAQNKNLGRPVMPRNMGNPMMPKQHYQQKSQQAKSRPPLWKEQMWQKKNYQPRPNGSTNTKQRGVPQSAQQGGNNRMIPPKGMYQYAPMYPSNYGYPQMPMWNGYNNGYYYQMMPYYWPVMPQKMPNTNNVQKQGVTTPSNIHNSIEGSSINGKK
ncbi:Multidrug resistance protein MdtC [Nymphon striatum]|nr:Multidrug resistance protein MdtC [Nymphon striatum]